jgi:hypothetical protein
MAAMVETQVPLVTVAMEVRAAVMAATVASPESPERADSRVFLPRPIRALASPARVSRGAPRIHKVSRSSD